MKPVYTVSIPDYKTEGKPTYEKWGLSIDTVLRLNFFGKKIAVRYLSTEDHAGMSAEELIKIIETTGTDKYDPNRKMSVAHDFYAEKGIDLFAVKADVDDELNISAQALEDFFEGAIMDRGYAIQPNVLVVYDRDQLETISIVYDDGVGEDGYKFKNAEKKADAVLGFIKIVE